jgi:hypothetical protein
MHGTKLGSNASSVDGPLLWSFRCTKEREAPTSGGCLRREGVASDFLRAAVTAVVRLSYEVCGKTEVTFDYGFSGGLASRCLRDSTMSINSRTLMMLV